MLTAMRWCWSWRWHWRWCWRWRRRWLCRWLRSSLECFYPFFDVSSSFSACCCYSCSLYVCVCFECVCVCALGHHTVSLFFYNFLLLFRFLLVAAFCNVFLSVAAIFCSMWRQKHTHTHIHSFTWIFLCSCVCVFVCWTWLPILLLLEFPLHARHFCCRCCLRCLRCLRCLLTTNMAAAAAAAISRSLFAASGAANVSVSVHDCCMCPCSVPFGGLQLSLSSVRLGLAKSIGRRATCVRVRVACSLNVCTLGGATWL